MTCTTIIAVSEQFVYTVAVLVLMAGLLALNDWIRRGSRKKKPAAATNLFEQRLKNPKFEELEKHFRRPFPQGIKALYSNPDEIQKENFQVIAESADGKETIWSIAYYQPADLENVRDASSKTNEVFEFANDGSGNGYTIDPLLDDPPVMFDDHETGEWDKVADTFAKFMAMPRRSRK